MIAASFGHVSIIKKLVKYSEENAETSDAKNIIAKKIGLHLADEGGFTALHYAVFYGHHPTIEYLLQLGSDPNVPDIEGMTPTLMACVDQFQEESLPALIKAGGSLYHCNHDGQNGFDIAKRKSLLSFQTHKPEGTLYGSF
uniref:Ankyrin repeat protein n=1 Tax=Panagrolaimus superbus TaxID=310955 RepID=A0A914YSL0_9BILA